jgi:hypothetical protein
MIPRSDPTARGERRLGVSRPWGSGAIALIGCLLLVLPVSAQGPTPSAGPDAPSASAGPGASGTPTPGATELEPGRHSWSELGIEVSLDFGEGWAVSPPLDGPIVTFERADMPGGVVTLTRFDGDTYADSCDESSITWVEPSAERLIEIIGGNPFLEADSPEPIELAGSTGQSIDVSTPPFTPDECRIALLLIWAIPMKDGEFVQIAGQESRFIALDVGTDTVVIAIETLPGTPFDPFALEAMELLGSIAFGPA